MKAFGSVARGECIEKKNAAGKKIADKGMLDRTNLFNPFDKTVSSTYFKVTRDNSNRIPACACPARNKSCLNGLSIYPDCVSTNKPSRLTPPYITVGKIMINQPANLRDSSSTFPTPFLLYNIIYVLF